MKPPPFAYCPGMLAYGFGPDHPWQPERLRRAVALCEAMVPGLEAAAPDGWDESRLETVHDRAYLEIVRLASQPDVDMAALAAYGLGDGDTPRFDSMYEAASLVCAGADWAARQVVAGAPVAVSLGGGLHHAHRDRASGFCVLNDCVVALDRLRGRYGRVAYIDIDLHHGDGVQSVTWDEEDVMTYSVHESGKYLFPGTGGVDEVGRWGNKFNAPMDPHTTGDIWLATVRESLLPAVEAFRPEAVVLQMGCDAHMTDPLGDLDVTDREWLEAVRLVMGLGLPTLALGGGGYDMANVPRMWAAAVVLLAGGDPEAEVPRLVGEPWTPTRLLTDEKPPVRGRGRKVAEVVVNVLRAQASRLG
ncbi:MAG: hypothetical protein KF857_01045 [Fimbriimonadaceae bacterium]|nr:hypothetical protein [Fimbriimonadaceae bacterium]